jgi:hypothetical protein
MRVELSEGQRACRSVQRTLWIPNRNEHGCRVGIELGDGSEGVQRDMIHMNQEDLQGERFAIEEDARISD